jgi:hypothetical protein
MRVTNSILSGADDSNLGPSSILMSDQMSSDLTANTEQGEDEAGNAQAAVEVRDPRVQSGATAFSNARLTVDSSRMMVTRTRSWERWRVVATMYVWNTFCSGVCTDNGSQIEGFLTVFSDDTVVHTDLPRSSKTGLFSHGIAYSVPNHDAGEMIQVEGPIIRGEGPIIRVEGPITAAAPIEDATEILGIEGDKDRQCGFNTGETELGGNTCDDLDRLRVSCANLHLLCANIKLTTTTTSSSGRRVSARSCSPC